MSLSDERRGPFGLALKRSREQRQVSQSKLAERAGFDHSYVSRLEAGSRQPTRDAVTQLAAALHLDGASTDRLLAAAGFLSRNVAVLMDDEPEVARILALLADASVPLVVRDTIRTQLVGIAVLCQGAVESAVAS